MILGKIWNNSIINRNMRRHCQILNYIKQTISYTYLLKYEEYFKKNELKLKKFKNKHTGERCFIIGTGPSLNKTNLSLIKNETIFGVNTLYKGLKKFGIKPDYWAVSDSNIYPHVKNIEKLEKQLFLAGGAAIYHIKDKKEGEKIIYIRRLPGYMDFLNKFPKDLTKGAISAYTVVIFAIELAYYMGFKAVYLLGCDCDYKNEHQFHGEKNKSLGSWQPFANTKEFDRLMKSYKICKKAFEEDGRKIFNATPEGKLEVFERKSLEEVILKK